jgi:hypothetical protein
MWMTGWKPGQTSASQRRTAFGADNYPAPTSPRRIDAHRLRNHPDADHVRDDTVQVELDQGKLNLRVRRLYDGDPTDTPNLVFPPKPANTPLMSIPITDLTSVNRVEGLR